MGPNELLYFTKFEPFCQLGYQLGEKNSLFLLRICFYKFNCFLDCCHKLCGKNNR